MKHWNENDTKIIPEYSSVKYPLNMQITALNTKLLNMTFQIELIREISLLH